MATTTTNLGLTKPAGTEVADIAVINSNMDTIDSNYYKVSQSNSATNTTYPILMSSTGNSSTSNVTGTTLKSNKTYINPSIGTIFSNGFESASVESISHATTDTTSKYHGLVKTDWATSWHRDAYNGHAVINLTGAGSSHKPILKYNTTNGVGYIAAFGPQLNMYYDSNANIANQSSDANWNGAGQITAVLMDEGGNASWPGQIAEGGTALVNKYVSRANNTTQTNIDAMFSSSQTVPGGKFTITTTSAHKNTWRKMITISKSDYVAHSHNAYFRIYIRGTGSTLNVYESSFVLDCLLCGTNPEILGINNLVSANGNASIYAFRVATPKATNTDAYLEIFPYNDNNTRTFEVTVLFADVPYTVHTDIPATTATNHNVASYNLGQYNYMPCTNALWSDITGRSETTLDSVCNDRFLCGENIAVNALGFVGVDGLLYNPSSTTPAGYASSNANTGTGLMAKGVDNIRFKLPLVGGYLANTYGGFMESNFYSNGRTHSWYVSVYKVFRGIHVNTLNGTDKFTTDLYTATNVWRIVDNKATFAGYTWTFSFTSAIAGTVSNGTTTYTITQNGSSTTQGKFTVGSTVYYTNVIHFAHAVGAVWAGTPTFTRRYYYTNATTTPVSYKKGNFTTINFSPGQPMYLVGHLDGTSFVSERRLEPEMIAGKTNICIGRFDNPYGTSNNSSWTYASNAGGDSSPRFTIMMENPCDAYTLDSNGKLTHINGRQIA